MPQRILIIGAGNVGGAIGQKWLKRGHDVRFGVPDPASPRYASLPKDRLQRPDDRAGADIVVLAVPFEVVGSAIAALGDLAGVTFIDCTNPLGMGPEGLQLVIGHDSSGAEQVAAHASGASVFKTSNQTGWENMGSAEAYQPTPVMFVAGDDNDQARRDEPRLRSWL
jgi:predicted dinucleotide-binding enzyme